MRDRILDVAMAVTMFLILIYAAASSLRADMLTESNLTLSRLLDEQMEINRAKLTELEAVIDALIHEPPRVADSLRMALRQ